jgi:hypothetical protein
MVAHALVYKLQKVRVDNLKGISRQLNGELQNVPVGSYCRKRAIIGGQVPKRPDRYSLLNPSQSPP